MPRKPAPRTILVDLSPLVEALRNMIDACEQACERIDELGGDSGDWTIDLDDARAVLASIDRDTDDRNRGQWSVDRDTDEAVDAAVLRALRVMPKRARRNMESIRDACGLPDCATVSRALDRLWHAGRIDAACTPTGIDA